MTSPPNDGQLRIALKHAAAKQAAQRRQIMRSEHGLLTPQAQPSPEHYHLIYHVKNEVSIPDFKRVFLSSREAYAKVHEMAQQAEPRVEWYDDGRVGFETRLHGRADLWWVILEVAACIRSICKKTLERNNMKRRLILLPGDPE